MSKSINFIVEVAIAPEKEAEFKELAKVIVAETAKDSGVIYYHWAYDDGICHIVEHYDSNESTERHFKMFGERFAEQFAAVGTTKSCILYGEPSPVVKSVLDGFNCQYTTTLASYER